MSNCVFEKFDRLLYFIIIQLFIVGKICCWELGNRMDDQKQLFLFAFPVPSNEDHLIDRIKEASSARNQHGAVSTAALANIDADSIAQLAVGPNHVAFLFKCGRVARLKYTLTTATREENTGDEKSSSGTSGGAGSGSSGSGSGPTTGGSSGSSAGAGWL
ncbi:unnamed protein product, partial [Onchocerca flexuosa]|uniref:tRNA_edit domain-containing protein n=1 Tax=Onchocerca flexuosa TaxID=387005 RepID=A0A183HKE0_9BILA